MKTKILLLGIALLSLSSLLNAQINGKAKITVDELIIQKTKMFDELVAKDFSSISEPGHPKLPVKIETYVVPYDAEVTGISINSLQKEKMDGKYYVYPAQPPRPLDWSEPPEFVEPDPEIYNSTSPYPGKRVEIVSDGYSHGYHVVTVATYPVEYIPKNREIYLLDIDFTIQYSTTGIQKTATSKKQSFIRNKIATNHIKSVTKNPDDVERFGSESKTIIPASNDLNNDTESDTSSRLKSLSVKEELVPDYLIITNEALKPVFQELADWKTKKGFPALIKTTEEIIANYPGADAPEQIRNYLKEAYSKWDASLFVLLGGDVNIVPARFVPGECCPTSPTDLYYATIEGTWNANNNQIYGQSGDNVDKTYDFYLGRASVQDETEAQAFVDKVIGYEKYTNLSGSNYVNNNLYLVGFLNKDCGVSYYSYTQDLKNISSTYIPSDMNNWFVIDNYDCQFNPSDHYEYPFAYHFFTDPHCKVTAYLNESFEDNIDPADDLPQGWEKDDNNWERVTPPSNIGEHHYRYVMKFKSSTIGSGNSSCLLSPSLDISNDNQYLRFSMYRDVNNTKNDKIVVEYELNGSGTWKKLGETKRYDDNGSNNYWDEIYYKDRYYKIVKLPQGNIKIRFKGVSDGGNDIYIDHIKIAKKFAVRPGGDCHSGNQTLNKTNATACLNNGSTTGYDHFHLVYHLQHSGVKGMGLSKVTGESLSLEDFDGLTNGDYHQIMFSNGCKPATFSYDCMGEHYINNPNGGGVAFIGNADYGYYGEHYQFENFCDALYKTTDHPNITSYLGVAFQEAPNNTESARKRLTLLGDPQMPVWTQTPQTLDVSVSPTTVVSGENTIVVTLNNLPASEDAMICLQKGDEGYARQMVTGSGSYNFTFTPHTTGTIDVTVTAHNFIPYETTIPVDVNQDQNLYITDITYDDDKTGASYGNNDQQNDAGETIELAIDLKNNGLTDATSISATLSCNTTACSNITLTNDQSDFGDIASGETKACLSNYVITIDKDAPEILENDTDPITFVLEITDGSSTTYTDEFNITIFAPEIEQGNKTYTIIDDINGNGEIDAGDQVEMNIDLFNAGKAEATGVVATLSCSSSDIASCTTTPVSYPDIHKHETKTGNSTFQFTVAGTYTTGDPLNFSLHVENEYGKIWDTYFNLLDKPNINLIGEIEFTGYQNEIKLMWDDIDNIKGYNIYRSDADEQGNEVGNYQKVNTFPVTPATFKDYGLEELTKYYYKISAVSLTGNESALSSEKLAWTSYPLKENFPYVMGHSSGKIISSINVKDIDNDGFKEIFSGISVHEQKGYLIGIHHNGTEIFDIDANPTTKTGFAELDATIQSTPAIGDINKDGIYEVVSCTRDLGDKDGRTNYITFHSYKDNNPSDNKPDIFKQHTTQNPYYRAPVIANLDNSSDGTLETVFVGNWGSGIEVYNSSGNLLYNFAKDLGSIYSSIAVADLDNDLDKEIIACFKGKDDHEPGVYIWHHDGSDFGSNQPVYTKSGYKFGCSPVVCNGKHIITSVLNESSDMNMIIAIYPNGETVPGWNGSQTIKQGWLTHEVSVGDIDRNGNLEVVALGDDVVKVWSHSGELILSESIETLTPHKLTPILADVDDDVQIEILFGSFDNGKIYAINLDGSKVIGFPLYMDNGMEGSLCVSDVDNNGKNEVISASGNKIYMWETNGDSELIGWGSERYNHYNTGEHPNALTPPDYGISNMFVQNKTFSDQKHIIAQNDISAGSDVTTSIPEGPVTVNNGSNVTIRPGQNLTIKNDFEVKIGAEFTVATDNTYPNYKMYYETHVNTNQSDGTQWHTEHFDDEYENPVVVMGPVSHNGSDPSTVRVKNTSPTSFDYQIDEWDYLDGGHTSERIDYIVMEAGTYNLGGLKTEAGIIEDVNGSFSSHSFSQSFEEKPVVIAQVVTANGASAVTTRLKNISTSGFEVKAQEEQGNDGTHYNEKVAFIAIEPGYGSLYGQLLEVGRTDNTVTDDWYTVSFDNNNFTSTPTSFVGQIQTYDGSDPCNLRKQSMSNSEVTIKVEEEKSADSETNHTSEVVGYIVIE